MVVLPPSVWWARLRPRAWKYGVAKSCPLPTLSPVHFFRCLWCREKSYVFTLERSGCHTTEFFIEVIWIETGLASMWVNLFLFRSNPKVLRGVACFVDSLCFSRQSSMSGFLVGLGGLIVRWEIVGCWLIFFSFEVNRVYLFRKRWGRSVFLLYLCSFRCFFFFGKMSRKFDNLTFWCLEACTKCAILKKKYLRQKFRGTVPSVIVCHRFANCTQLFGSWRGNCCPWAML